MDKAVAELKETALHSEALPQYFVDLIFREIEEGNTSPQWAKKIEETIHFIEGFLPKQKII